VRGTPTTSNSTVFKLSKVLTRVWTWKTLTNS
jgi:hypothetical protein